MAVIFWLIAVAMAGFIAVILSTGEVRIRGKVLAERSTGPRYLWFCVGVFTFGLLVVVMQAIQAP